MTINKAVRLCLLAGTACALLPAAGWAQSEPRAAGASGLDDIVVTARRRAESVQDIPVAVQAISAEQVQQRDLTSLEKIATATPQFTVSRASNGAGAQLTMRGIGSNSTSIGIEQSVAVVVDGVYYGQGRIINEGFFDLERVEVLKGPQALFFGKNATAGVISLTTADPGPEAEYIGRIGYEIKAKQLYGEAIASTPISEDAGIRIAVRGSKMWGGYYKNRSTGFIYNTIDAADFSTNPHYSEAAATNQPQEKEFIGRMTVKYEPSDQLSMSLKLSGSYNGTIGNGWNYTPVDCVGGATPGVTTGNPNYPCTGGFNLYQDAIPEDIAATVPYSRKDGDVFNTYKSWQATGTINYTIDNVNINSITNYNWNNNKFMCDCDFLGQATWATENASYRAISQELRVTTDFDGPLNLMLGGLFQDTKRDFYQAVLFAGSEDSTAAPENRYVSYAKLSKTDGRTLSAYGQVMWNIIPGLEATAGVRYIHETKKSFFTQPYVNPFLYGIFRPESATVDGTIYGDQTFNDWSPDFTLSWKPTDGVMLFASYREAYKSGGFSNSAINSAMSPNPASDFNFNPEKGHGFEAGIKSTLAENQLRLNLTAYSFKYTDLQIDYFQAETFAYVTYNAGSARTKGVELEVEFAPRDVPGLSLQGALNYNSARYRSFLAPCYGGQSRAAGCVFGPDGNISNPGSFQDLSGAPTAMAPKWAATLGASYESAIGDGLKIGANANMRYSGSYLGSGFGDPRTRQSSYAVLDAGIRIGAENDRWQLALIGKNITNKFYFNGAGTGPLTGSGTGTDVAVGGDIMGYGAAPRTVRMQLSIRY